MNDYFQHLIERSMGGLPAIRPRLPSLYEPQGSKDGRQRHVPVHDQSPASGTVEDANLSFPAQRDAFAWERMRAQGQAPIRTPMRDLPENQAKTKAVRAASALAVSASETTERDEGADGLHPSIRPGYPHRRETAGFPANSASVLCNNDDSPLLWNAGLHHAHPQKATSPGGEWTPGNPLPLPGENAHDSAAYPVTYPYRTPGDPVHPDPMGRVEPQPEMKTPSSGDVAVQGLERTLIRPFLERQTDLLIRERPELTMPKPAPAGQTIRVTIGRIDVRAVMPRTLPATAQQKPAVPQPKVSLEEYLKKQWGGRK
jgi:hypothetical protein